MERRGIRALIAPGGLAKVAVSIVATFLRLRLLIVLAGTILLAAILWAISGYFALMPLGLMFGWGGHPAIPSAPESVYVALYLVVLPLLSLFVSWRVLRRFARPRSRPDAVGSQP